MLDHGLMEGQPEPSVEVLTTWLKEHDVQVSDGVAIAPMEDGSGWRVVAARDLEPIEPSTPSEPCYPALTPSRQDPKVRHPVDAHFLASLTAQHNRQSRNDLAHNLGSHPGAASRAPPGPRL